MTTTAELIARCRTDLTLIAQLIPWAHTDAYNPTNAPTERPISTLAGAGTALDELGNWLPATTTPDPDPDHVPGARYDLGLGSHTSRRAYETAVVHIHAAELSIGTAWTFTTSRNARLLKPLATDPAAKVLRTIDATRLRLDDLVSPSSQPYAVRILIGRAADHLDKAWRSLNGAFTIGAADPDTQAQADPCRICEIRAAAERAGGRCHTCKTWRDRNGYERPTKLDSVHDAVAAQERRLARGEGYGEA